ncbi:MAG TPA: SRPBCC family protein [Solirubrobacteraceae bacterium]
MNATDKRSVVHATFTIERTYEVAPARVFGAWAEPAAKASWFGPKSLPHESREFDFQVGGHERFAIDTPDGSTYLFDSRYQDIVSDQRIVYAYDMYRDETRISVSLATIELEATGTSTKLRFTEQAVFLDGQDTPAEREHGTGVLLDNLGDALR